MTVGCLSASPAKGIEYITVVCRVCGTRVDERVADEARDVRCPDCHKPVRIPGRAQIPAPAAKAEVEDPGVYQISAKPAPTGPEADRKSRRPKKREFLVACPLCHARLHPPIRPEAYKVRCPDCHRPVRVPGQEEAREILEKQATPDLDVGPIETIPLGKVHEPPRRATSFFAVQAQKIRREAPPKPPEWTWFSGVWTFPWQLDVIHRWLVISIGLTCLGGLLALLISMYVGAGHPVAVVMAFLLLPALWIFLWTASYVSASWLAVIVDTAAGNKSVVEWPELAWRDGIYAFLAILFQWGVAAVVGHVIGKVCELAGAPESTYWICLDVSVAVLFPFLILSMLETGAWYRPFSRAVARSVSTHFSDWFMCYLLLDVSFGGFSYLWARMMNWSLLAGLLATGWMWAAMILISARLLGRLGWKLTQDPRE